MAERDSVYRYNAEAFGTNAAPQPKAPERPEKPEKAEKVEKPEKVRPEITNKEELLAAADTFLNDVFTTMGINVERKLSFRNEDNSIEIELSGEDRGVLIGKRGHTLDSFQYLTSLVVNKKSDGYVRVKIDTENYRERRKEILEKLARNMANKARRTRKPVTIEPMNPYERRIIHSTLQSNPYVETYSEGVEPYRKVVIAPKRK